MEVTVTEKGSGRYFEGVGLRFEGEVIVCNEQVGKQWATQGFVTKGRAKAAKKASSDQEGAE